MKKFSLRAGVFSLFLVLIFGLTPAGWGQSVPVSGYNTLVEALDAGVTDVTNFSTNAVTISFSASTFPAIQVSNNVTIDAGTNSVVFQSDGTTRFFYVRPNASLTLNNLELTHGASTNGGAIFNEGALIVSNCVLTGNVATNTDGVSGGNGPFGGQGNGTNGAPGGTASGGAIYSTGSVMISYSILTNNFAEAGNGGNGGTASGGLANGGAAGYGGNAYGGALFSSGATNIFYMTEFVGNECRAGGGGTGGYFATNAPPYEGSGGSAGVGGSAAGGGVLVTGALHMTNCLIANNYAVAGTSGGSEVDSDGGGASGSPGGASEGGGLYVATGVTGAWMQNSIFYFNSCYGGQGGSTSLNAATGGEGGEVQGGAIWSGATTAEMAYCTVANNFLYGGPGGTNTAAGFSGQGGQETAWDIYKSKGVFDLGESILAGTNAPNAVGVADEGYNICSDGSLTKNSIVTTTKLNNNPQVGGLAAAGPQVGGNFGALMATVTIPNTSVAAGFIPGVPGATFPATDEILQDRGTPTSAGAYEATPIILQTNATLVNITSISPGTNLTGNGGTVTFTATVDSVTYSNANRLPFGYQWQLDGTNISQSANYSGTTSNVLTVKNITIVNQGNYTLLASPTLLEGTNISPVVMLVLTNPPSILAQPVSQIGRPSGSIVTFTVNVPGASGFDYQWLLNGSNIPATSEYSGTNSNVLTIDPATAVDQGTYSVIISNSFNPSAVKTSAGARLTIVTDHGKPSVAITSPKAGIRTNALVLTGTAQDNAQVSNVMYWFTNINLGLPANMETNVISGVATLTTNGNTNFNSGPNKVLWSITNAPMPGTNILAVQSIDYSGNLSPIVTRHFFYEAPTNLVLSVVNNGGSGTVVGHAFVHGDVVPSSSALLNIGEGYTLVAKANASSLLGDWTNTSAGVVHVTNGNTLKFIMESDTVIQASFVSNIFLGAGGHGTYNGLFYVEQITNEVTTNGSGTNELVTTNEVVSNEVAFASAGMVANLSVTKQGTFTGKLLVGGGSYNLNGTFDAFGHVTNRAVARSTAAGGPLLVSLNLNTNGAGVITGTVSNESWPTNSTLWADIAAPTAGTTNFTLLMLPPTNAPTNGSVPLGDGYALLTDHGGTVTLSGGLADGATFNQTVPASKEAFVPVYAGLYNKTGFLLGWINLTNLNSSNAADGLTWIKGIPPHPSVLFPNGFTNTLPTEGSIWVNPGTVTLPAGDLLTASNADLDLNYPVEIEGSDKIVAATGTSTPVPTNSLAGTVNLKNGRLQITFGNGTGKATAKGYGAMLQDTAHAGGYFVTKTNTGIILLQPPVTTNAPVIPQDSEEASESLILTQQSISSPPLPPSLATHLGGSGAPSTPPQP